MADWKSIRGVLRIETEPSQGIKGGGFACPFFELAGQNRPVPTDEGLDRVAPGPVAGGILRRKRHDVGGTLERFLEFVVTKSVLRTGCKGGGSFVQPVEGRAGVPMPTQNPRCESTRDTSYH
jgi:hypothetical protein